MLKSPRPVPIAGSEFEMEADMVLPAIGQSPGLSFLGDREGILRAGNLLSADPVTLQTGLERVFAGGDAVTGPAAVIDALAAGRAVATPPSMGTAYKSTRKLLKIGCLSGS